MLAGLVWKDNYLPPVGLRRRAGGRVCWGTSLDEPVPADADAAAIHHVVSRCKGDRLFDLADARIF